MANKLPNDTKAAIADIAKRGIAQLGKNATSSAVTAVSRKVDQRLNPADDAEDEDEDELAVADEDAEYEGDEDEDEDEDDDDEGEDDDEDEDDEDDEDFDEDDLASAVRLPLCFEYVDNPKENLRCAVAAWKLLGRDSASCKKGADPDIVAVHPDGRAYVGSIPQWLDFCEANDLHDDWDLLGVDTLDLEAGEVQYNSEELRNKHCSKSALYKVIAAAYDKKSLEQAREMHDGFHWNEDGAGTTVITEIPGITQSLAFLGAFERLDFKIDSKAMAIDLANSKSVPKTYALGDKVVVIHGGKFKIPQSLLAKATKTDAKIPGISGEILRLAQADNIIYFARKGGEVARYTHKFGEHAKTSPDVYVLGNNCLVIFGGQMVVEDRGIVH